MIATENAARLMDLERRIRELEAARGIPDAAEYDRETLVSLYICASRAQPITEESALLWATTTRGLTTAALLELARAVRDPFPWKPFLAVLDACTSAGYPVRGATARLVAAARDLLELQGLRRLVDVGDVMGTPLQVQQASAAISVGEEEPHDELRSQQHQAAQRIGGCERTRRNVLGRPHER